jgi:hypothetical protein
MKYFCNSIKLFFCKPWSLGLGGVTTKEILFTCVYIGKYFKNILKNYWARKAQIYTKAFSHTTKSNLLKSWPPGVECGHNRENWFYMYLYRIHYTYCKKKVFSRTTEPGKFKVMCTKSGLLKSWFRGSDGASIGGTILHLIIIKGKYFKIF